MRTPDPVLRNLRITLGYHDLARALASRLGPGANWFAFAVWASKQAGQTIRGEDSWRLLERELLLSPELTTALRGVVEAGRALGSRLGLNELRATLGVELDLEAVVRRAADAVARGNDLVFDGVGLARFNQQRACHAPWLLQPPQTGRASPRFKKILTRDS